MKSNLLIDRFPELIKEWHPTKNISIKVTEVTFGSNIKRWWICERGHEWMADPAHRCGRNSKCPYCQGSKVMYKNSLAALRPDIAKEWHTSKNNDLSPSDVRPGTDKKVWWLCEKGHEWQAFIYRRTGKKASGCSYCSRSFVHHTTCLAVTHPDVAKEWHPTNNGDKTPQDVLSGSGTKVWWVCGLGHEWQASIMNRAGIGAGCHTCRNVSSSKIEQLLYYYIKSHFSNAISRYKHAIEDRKVETDIFIPNLNIAIEYDGSYYHKNKQKQDKLKTQLLESHGIRLIRIREDGLPLIKNTDIIHMYNIQDSIYDTIVNMLNLINKNVSISQPLQVSGEDMRQGNDHFYAKYLPRIKSLDMNVCTEYPDIAREWHPTKNGSMRPETTYPKSNMYAWWQCNTCSHDWRAKISNRTVNMRGCPKCFGNAVDDTNNFAVLHPDLAAEWHPRNAKSPTEYRQKSNDKVWWIGRCGHEWETSIGNRVKGKGCPEMSCSRKGRSATISEGSEYLMQEWDPEKNEILGLDPTKLTLGVSKEAWWKCIECFHEFKMVIKYRKYGSGCPECRKKKINRNPIHHTPLP